MCLLASSSCNISSAGDSHWFAATMSKTTLPFVALLLLERFILFARALGMSWMVCAGFVSLCGWKSQGPH